MNMFNAQGELNASSVQDALQTLSKYASIIEANNPSNLALSGQPSLSNEKRDQLIERAVMSHDGKIALAQAIN